jgi:AmmeMemoRadiSam system protein A
MEKQDRKRCLDWVRVVIKGQMEQAQSVFNGPEPGDSSGVFVTLHKNGELRGCVGQLSGSGRPLSEVLRDSAISAAFRDPRFSPLESVELKKIIIEISLLSPFRDIRSTDEIELGRHGVLLRNGFHSALFLPQVASEQGWDLSGFMEHLSLKAGLHGTAWLDKTSTFQVFTAEVFSERDFF